MSSNCGVLYVVATPIGNLGDITQRAIEVLTSVDRIAAEDTRTTKKLLNHLGIKQTCMSYHEHNEQQRIEVIKSALDSGQSVALVSDAGTPCISDPGYPLVSELRNSGYMVVPIPGACALVSALSVSGIATDRFAFEGFLASKPAARRKQISHLMYETRTLVFYESCHRIEATLMDMCELLGADRIVTVCRELTKKFETIRYDSLDNLCQWIQQSQQQKGEFVIIVSGYSGDIVPDIQNSRDILTVLLSYMKPSQAAAAAAQITGQRKKALYEMALEVQKNTDL